MDAIIETREQAPNQPNKLVQFARTGNYTGDLPTFLSKAIGEKVSDREAAERVARTIKTVVGIPWFGNLSLDHQRMSAAEAGRLANLRSSQEKWVDYESQWSGVAETDAIVAQANEIVSSYNKGPNRTR